MSAQLKNKKESFSKMTETLNYFGIELMNTDLTATKEAFLITSDTQV